MEVQYVCCAITCCAFVSDFFQEGLSNYIEHKTIDLLKSHIYSKIEAFRENVRYWRRITLRDVNLHLTIR